TSSNRVTSASRPSGLFAGETVTGSRAEERTGMALLLSRVEYGQVRNVTSWEAISGAVYLKISLSKDIFTWQVEDNGQTLERGGPCHAERTASEPRTTGSTRSAPVSVRADAN